MFDADWRWRRMWFYLNWEELRDRVRLRWPKLTVDDLKDVEGRREILVEKIRKRYGRTRPLAEWEVDAWIELRWASRSENQELHAGLQ